MNSIFHRISVRKYEDKPVEKEKIMEILKAGMQAPSACNQQPWEFYVVEDKEALKLLPLLAKEAAKFTTAAVICGGKAAETMQRAQNLHILNWGVDTTELAVKLYRLLRRCDKLGVGVIFSEGVTEDGIGLAVMNRMRKAAGRQVLTAADIEALLKNSTQLKSFVLK